MPSQSGTEVGSAQEEEEECDIGNLFKEATSDTTNSKEAEGKAEPAQTSRLQCNIRTHKDLCPFWHSYRRPNRCTPRTGP